MIVTFSCYCSLPASQVYQQVHIVTTRSPKLANQPATLWHFKQMSMPPPIHTGTHMHRLFLPPTGQDPTLNFELHLNTIERWPGSGVGVSYRVICSVQQGSSHCSVRMLWSCLRTFWQQWGENIHEIDDCWTCLPAALTAVKTFNAAHCNGFSPCQLRFAAHYYTGIKSFSRINPQTTTRKTVTVIDSL